MLKNICFIINPISGVKRRNSVVAAIDEILGDRGISYNLWFTSEEVRGEELCKQAIDEQFSCIVAVGGDGTVHEIGKTLINTDIPLGIIPLGSGNGLARNLKVPISLRRSLNNLITGSIVTIDTVNVNNEKFLGVAGVGFDAWIAYLFSKEKNRGMKTYTRLVMKEIVDYEAPKFVLNFKYNTWISEAFLITVANSGQYGNNAHIAPFANMQDGLLDICVMENFPLVQAPGLAARLFLRNIDTSRYYQRFRVKECIIEQEEEFVQLDGDVYNLGKKLHFQVNADSLKVIVPKKSPLNH